MPPANIYQINWGQVESIVQDEFMPDIQDQVFFGNPIYYRLQKRKKIYYGGRAIVQALSFTQEGGGGQCGGGVDKMDTRVRNPITAAVFYRKNYSLPIIITRDEEDSVGGDTALTTLVKAKMDIGRITAIDAIGQAIFNDGTDPKQIGGLQHMIRIAPGTSHTYGGITTSSTVNTWWQNQADNPGSNYVTGATGNTFAGVRGFGPIGRMWARIGRAAGTKNKPTMILSNWGSYQDYHDSLAGTGIGGAASMAGGQIYMQQDADLARAGFENVMYKTAPWVVDERAPHDANNLEQVFMVNEPSINLVIHGKRNMSFDGWKEPTDQRVRISYIDWSGEMVCSQRRCMGVINKVDTTLTSA